MTAKKKAGPILLITNHHVDPAPTLEVTPQDYVSYFMNQLGDQWIFVRAADADTASLYGGDVAWEVHEVRDRTRNEVRDELLAQGGRRLADQLQSVIDPLVPELILDEPERAWLNNAWWTSSRPAVREDDILRLAKELAQQHASPAFSKHPNTADYRGAMASFAFVIGREAGRRGLNDREAMTLFERAVQALPE